MITLTQPNKGELYRETITDLRHNFSKLLKRKFYVEKISGGLYVIETTNKGQGWHVHIHSIYEGKYISIRRLVNDWSLINNVHCVCDIRTVDNTQSALSYILKDLVKTPQIGGHIEDYDFAFRGVRFISCFGSWYNKIKPEPVKSKCKFCGSDSLMSWFEIRKELTIMEKSDRGTFT